MSSTSDSDADDEEEKKKKKIKRKVTAVSKKVVVASKPIATKQTVGTVVNKLKRKAEPSSSKSSASKSDSLEEEKLPQAKKTKTTVSITTAISGLVPSRGTLNTAIAASDSSDSSSSSLTSPPDSKSKAPASQKSTNTANNKPSVSGHNLEQASASSSESESTSSSEADTPAPIPAKTAQHKLSKKAAIPLPTVQIASSDSSATINGDSKKPSISASSVSDSSSATSSSDSESDDPPAKPAAGPTLTKKHQGAKPTPLAELSAIAADDSHLSNKYQSYEYADRAYKDLSVTRGKGFTKEKNKKKRGSYRGGAIDTAGGKSYKFED